MKTAQNPDKLHKPVLLVADDDALVLATIAAGLRDAGYTVFEASSGEEAIEIAASNNINLAILDIRMPGISGIETAKFIFDSYTIPFLFLSAFNDANTVADAINEGALGYLVKPVDVDNMIPTIETALSRSLEIKSLKSAEKNLSTALTQERDVSIAIGIILANSRCNAQDAENAMRRYARKNRIKMYDVARSVITAADNLNNLITEITG